jgi:hypothetical protein
MSFGRSYAQSDSPGGHSLPNSNAATSTRTIQHCRDCRTHQPLLTIFRHKSRRSTPFAHLGRQRHPRLPPLHPFSRKKSVPSSSAESTTTIGSSTS